ncbi:MAG: ornithine carbamoyltransferase [Planctomycetales bacterium]|nr:ornithine carbamoyltransferase [Planctomycetales bacterium]
MKHLDSLFRLTADDMREIFRISAVLKQKLQQGHRPALLAGRVMTLLFEKPSLRTRISFESAMAHLGGTSLFMTCAEAGLNGRESLSDIARVLGSYSDCIVTRTFSHRLVDDLVKHAETPIINGLSDLGHPCQALSDLFTIREELGTLEGKRLVYIGDGNNVARSLTLAAAILEMPIVLSSPLGYELTPEYVDVVKKKIPGANITLTYDPQSAVSRADIVYTDVWASMGQEAEQEKRKQIFAPYQINGKLMALAPKSARFMHCLPAKRGLEVTDEVVDGINSIVFQQAENRMHVAKGLLVWLLGISPAI